MAGLGVAGAALAVWPPAPRYLILSVRGAEWVRTMRFGAQTREDRG